MKTITQLRDERGWSQAELARRIDVQRQAVHYWEAGAKVPTVKHLRAIARVFGVSMDVIKLPMLNGHEEDR